MCGLLCAGTVGEFVISSLTLTRYYDSASNFFLAESRKVAMLFSKS